MERDGADGSNGRDEAGPPGHLDTIRREPTVSAPQALVALRRWLEQFHRDHGRPLRVLHFGNIANNAYLNAKFLRAVGVDAQVMSSDYYHIMATPEWEEIEVTRPYGDDNRPRFDSADLAGYERPHWFSEGTVAECLERIESDAVRALLRPSTLEWMVPEGALAGSYAQPESRIEKQIDPLALRLDGVDASLARLSVNEIKASGRLNQLTSQLEAQLNELTSRVETVDKKVTVTFDQIVAIRSQIHELYNQLNQLQRRGFQFFVFRWLERAKSIIGRVNRLAGWVFRRRTESPAIDVGCMSREIGTERVAMEEEGAASTYAVVANSSERASIAATASETGDACDFAGQEFRSAAPPGRITGPDQYLIGRAIADFAAVFPDRRDQLSRRDVTPYVVAASTYRRIFSHYDLVQCYGTHPIWGYLAGNRPYTGFEHGTLRTFTFEDDPLCRLTALGYRMANHTFVTNGDCLAYARALGISDFSAMIHPVDVELHRRNRAEAVAVKKRFNAEVLLFCPLRHDWKVKGTDIHLRALPLIRGALSKRVVLVLIGWGQQVNESYSLIAQIGCSDAVMWLPPLSRITMARLMQAADVVLDQIALPHFGATAPQALAAGTPVISSYRPESTAWIVPKPAPILPAFSPPEVRDAVLTALDPKWRTGFAERARAWVDRYHHPDRLVLDHLYVYQRILMAQNDQRQ
jgi:glycosyltransferase involved in cell wall biosynthesis